MNTSNRDYAPSAGEFKNVLHVKVLGVEKLADPVGALLKPKASPFVRIIHDSSGAAKDTKKGSGYTAEFAQAIEFPYQGRKFSETLSVEVWDGSNPKNPVLVGKTSIDCSAHASQGPAWPMGQWLPNDPSENWYPIDIDGEKAKKRKQRAIERKTSRLERLRRAFDAGAAVPDVDDGLDDDDHGHGKVRIAYFYSGPTTDRRVRDQSDYVASKLKAESLAREARLSNLLEDDKKALAAYEEVLYAYPEQNEEFLGYKTVMNVIRTLSERVSEDKGAKKIQAHVRRRAAQAAVEAKRRQLTGGIAVEPVQILDKSATAVPVMQEIEDGTQLDLQSDWQADIRSCLDGSAWRALTVFNTLYALFAIDISLCYFQKSVDYPLAIATFFVFLFFLADMSLNFIIKRDYGALPGIEKFNFFFILDLVGTISLIPEFVILFGGADAGVPDQAVLARVARAARIGARLSRVTKLFRFDNGKNLVASKVEAMEQKLHVGHKHEVDDSDISGKVAAEASEGISKRVIALVITLLVFVPIFDTSMPLGGLLQSKQDLLRLLQAVRRVDQNVSFELGASPEYESALNLFRLFDGHEVVYFTWNRDEFYVKNVAKLHDGNHVVDSTCTVEQCILDISTINSLRSAELKRYGDTSDRTCTRDPLSGKTSCSEYEFDGIEFWINFKLEVQHDALMNIFFMLFIMAIFTIASLVFMIDLERLVIEPTSSVSQAVKLSLTRLMHLSTTNGIPNEADYIEKSVRKIINLLKISFGDAGTETIQRNMTLGANEIDPMVPGEKVTGFYGFSDIKRFASIVDALKEKVIPFVNEMASICHQQCHETGGLPSTNAGDAFLNVWIGPSASADDVLTCYRRIVQGIRNSNTLQTMAVTKEMQARFPELATFSPSMNSAIHYGTSVEGAVGSVQKIDTSFMGLSLEIAVSLERLSQLYGTPILMTEDVYRKLSPQWKQTCRKIDRVSFRLRGSTYIYAANIANTEGNHWDPRIQEDVWPIEEDLEIVEKRQFALKQVQMGAVQELPKHLRQKEDLRWQAFVDDWNEPFEAAVDLYLAGDWPKARESFLQLQATREWDGPTRKILKYMDTNGTAGQAPNGWGGCILGDSPEIWVGSSI
eukprot:SAG31_NODE_541_length_14275_cov_6.690886_5_plen_1113_part_00